MPRSDSVTALRTQLLKNGYTPLPNLDKRCFLEGWAKVEVNEDELKKWARQRRYQATGVRLDNGLCMIDFDIDIDAELFGRFMAALGEEFPELRDMPWRCRSDGKTKLALFCRTTEPFNRLRTHMYVAPGNDEDEHDPAYIEIFGGATRRQAGAFGPHTVADNGEVKVTYEWIGDTSLATIPLRKLPAFDKAFFNELGRVAEEIMRELGFTQIMLSEAGEDVRDHVFDLTDDMKFDLNNGSAVSLDQLRELAGQPDLRCSASFLGVASNNRRRCLVGKDKKGRLTVWESASAITHLEASQKPRDALADLHLSPLGELQRRNGVAPERPADRATMQAKVRYLLESYAYCAGARLPVIPIYGVGQPMSMTNFRLLYNPWCEIDTGPRGGVNRINPVDMWTASTDRVAIGGIRMRPDMPGPLFTEAGQTWLNSYDPPVHDAAGGEIAPFLRFLGHLLPVDEERAWFLQWLAYKFQQPHIPGPAVLMVARQFGTGRGTLGEILGRLFGRRYVVSATFHDFIGSTYQSQYNDWSAETLITLVNESSDAGGTTKDYKRAIQVYEQIKEIVDPRPLVRYYKRKGEPNFSAVSSTSYLIATNHANALPIPENDRRIAVLTNGDPAPEAFWQGINDWMEQPQHIAALARYLAAHDTSSYKPFVPPPRFHGLKAMVESTKSDLDNLYEEALETMEGEVFAVIQLVNRMNELRLQGDYDLSNISWKNIVRNVLVPRDLHRVAPEGNSRTQIDGTQLRLYTTTPQNALRWNNIDRQKLVDEVAKSGPVKPVSLSSILRSK